MSSELRKIEKNLTERHIKSLEQHLVQLSIANEVMSSYFGPPPEGVAVVVNTVLQSKRGSAALAEILDAVKVAVFDYKQAEEAVTDHPIPFQGRQLDAKETVALQTVIEFMEDAKVNGATLEDIADAQNAFNRAIDSQDEIETRVEANPIPDAVRRIMEGK